MNRIFKVIWSKTKNCYVVASELAKGTSKSTSTGRMAKRAVLAAVAALLISPLGAGYVSAVDYVTVKDTSDTEQTVYTKDGVDIQLGEYAKNTTVSKNTSDISDLKTADEQLQTNIDNEAAAREAKDNELNEQITNYANVIHKTTNKLQDDLNTETTAREANDTALDTRITNVKEYLEKQTSDNYVSKADAAVQDGAVVKAANTIGDNVTKLDAALASETAARIGADKAQDKVIQQVNQNMVDGFNTINTNMANGFAALNQADANEAAAREAADTVLDDKITAETSARVVADTKLVEAVNSGLSLSNDNVLQKNTTTIDAQGNVTTSKTDAKEMILNKGKDNQITLNEKGIKVGTNSTVVDKDGVYTGGDTYSEAKAALKSDGSIKGADGKFTVNSANGTVNVNDQIELNGATGVVKSNGLNVGDGNMTVSNNGNINTVGTLSVADGNFKVNSSGGVTAAGGKTTLASDGSIKAADGKFTVNSNGGVKAADGKITLSSDGSVKAADGKFTVNSNGAVKAANGNTTIDSNGNLKTAGTLSAADGSFKVDSNGKITSTGLDAGNGTIQTTGTVKAGDVQTGTLETTGDATIGGNLTVDKNLTVNGEFNAKTLSSKLDENNYTTITGGKTQSVNLKMDTATGETKASASTFDETGSNMWANDDDSIGKSTVTADGISQKLSDTGDNPTAYAESTMSQGTDNKYTMTDTVKDGDKTNVASQSASESSNVITEGTGDSTKTSTFQQRVDEILNQINSSDTVFSKVDQKVDSITSEVTDGTNTTSSTQTTTDITNTAKQGTITNEAQKLVNKASDTISNEAANDITNTSTNGNIANTANNGTISNTAKNIENTASENITNTAKNGSITNDAKNIVNKASETLSNEAKNITNKTTEDMTNTIGKNLTTTVGGDMSTEITGNQTNTVKGTLTETVTGKATENYNGGLETTITGEEKHTVNGTQTNNITGDQTTTVGGNQTATVTGDSSLIAKNITNSATEKLSNTAADIENKASTSILNQVGDNTSWKMTDGQVVESIKGADGQTNTTTTTADDTYQSVQNGNKVLAKRTSSTNDNLNITDGTNTYSKITTATSNKQTVTDGKETASTNLTKSASNTYITNGTQTVTNHIAADTTNTVMNEGSNGSRQEQTASQILDRVTDGTNTNSTTTTASGTTFENTAHNTALTEMTKHESGDFTKTTISGNTIETGQATMDYAEVMKDLGVHGNATVDGNTSVGGNLSVTGTSTLTGDVTMKSNATVENNLTVKGTTTTKELVVNNSATVTGGTTTDTLHVTSTSTFDGKATFKDIVTMEKDLSVAGSITASSYKVGDKTYIDSNGINANDQKVVNVAPGRIAADSKDAVNGSQLYQTNERVTSVENRVGTVENRVDKLDSRVDKVGANAAALANLHPLEFDADSKWNIAAAVGGYKGETATAIGAFYRPNENVMVNVSSSFGTGENMYGGGISLRIGQGGNKARRNATNGLTEREKAMQKQIDSLTSRLDALLSVINPNMSKDFPDVPENHWAYEAVSRLAGNGVIQGYEDGKYHGDRTMTRYEMAEIIYNALSKGAKAEKKLVEEFKPELQAMAAQKKA